MPCTKISRYYFHFDWKLKKCNYLQINVKFAAEFYLQTEASFYFTFTPRISTFGFVFFPEASGLTSENQNGLCAKLEAS